MWNIHQDASKLYVCIWGAITFAFLGWINPWSELNWNIRQISMSKLSPSMRMKRCAKMPCLCFFCQVVATAGRCGNLCDSDFRQCVLWVCLARCRETSHFLVGEKKERRPLVKSISVSIFTDGSTLLVTFSQANLWYHLAGPPGAVPKNATHFGWQDMLPL